MSPQNYLTHQMEQNDHLVPHGRMLSEKRLAGKVVVITGGARGIGAGIAKLFADEGARVVVADIQDELGKTLANSIGGRYIHCDVAKESDVESAVELALAWKGQLDIMLNNAGIAGLDNGSITNLQMENLKALLAVNVNGIVHGIKHAAKAMIARGKGGSIICMSSSAALMGGLASHSYTLSKGAILGIMRSAACELGVHAIRVNSISPHGIVKETLVDFCVATEMLVSGYRKVTGKADLTCEEVSKLVGESGSLLSGRAPSVEDVARAALFLAGDEAGYVTGHNLVVDGGYTSAFSRLSFIYQG